MTGTLVGWAVVPRAAVLSDDRSVLLQNRRRRESWPAASPYALRFARGPRLAACI